MPIDFHAPENRLSYATRQADSSWKTAISDMVDVKGKRVLDIGCGGGIYTKALADMGAASVTGVDSSKTMLEGAIENCRGYANIDFVMGNALCTGASGQSKSECGPELSRVWTSGEAFGGRRGAVRQKQYPSHPGGSGTLF